MAAPSLRARARTGILWSALQSWGGKIITFLLSILLARLLSPEEFGIAGAAALALLLVPLLAEMGFGDAILQRRSLQPADLNLPFWLATGVAVLLVGLVLLYRDPIARWAGLGGHGGYLVAIAATMLIAVPNAFQEAMFKRSMRFRSLALRSFAANMLGGLAAVAAALAGLGIWAFVLQAWVATGINVIWIWARPEWRPGLQARPQALGQMLRFGLPVLAQRLVDVAGNRALDLIIIARVGLGGYGVYLVGARLYQTLMQLLQGAFHDVSLTVLSQIAHDRDRLAGVYRQTIAFSATVLSPVFVLFAALAPEVCLVLFGPGWAGVDRVAQLLLLLGAVNCVQYMNGPFQSARGRPGLNLATGALRSLLQIMALSVIPASGVAEMTLVFVLASVAVMPLSFFLLARGLGLSLAGVLGLLLRPALLSAACFGMVWLLRPALAAAGWGVFGRGVALALLFLAAYLALLMLLDRRAARQIGHRLAPLWRRIRRRGPGQPPP